MNVWHGYFRQRRGVQHTEDLTTDDLVAMMHSQGGRCALTGVPMTFERGRGRNHVTPTNASIDRIEPGKPYHRRNVQLVCAAVNKFRGDLPLPEFIEWCRRVVRHHDKEPHGDN